MGGWRAGLGQGRSPILPGPWFQPDIWAQGAEGAVLSDPCAIPLTAPSTPQLPGDRRGQFCALLSQLTQLIVGHATNWNGLNYFWDRLNTIENQSSVP